MITESQRTPLLTREMIKEAVLKLIKQHEEQENEKIKFLGWDEDAISYTIQSYDNYEFGELTSLEEFVEQDLFGYFSNEIFD